MRWLPLLLMLGCTPEEDAKTPKDAPSCEGGERITSVLRALTFGRQEPQGVTWGFDLDGRDSDSADSGGCNKVDMVDPDGNTGIDSAFSGLVPALEATEAAAVEGLIQDAILSGELMMLFSVDGVDDPVNDDCVGIDIVHGMGTPLLGTDGNLLDGQTLARDPDAVHERVSNASIVDGTLIGHDLNVQIAMQILDEFVTFDLADGMIRVDLAEDGTMSGYFGGGVGVQQIVEATDFDDVGISDLVASLVTAAADLKPVGGTCEELSITFEFEAVPAFLFD